MTAVAGGVTYVYGASGQTRDYIDGIEYVGGTMELIHTKEGRIVRSGDTYTYHYFLRDHLGNNRAGFAGGTNVTVPDFTTDYYPFGLQYVQAIARQGSPKNNYLYGGKELQDGIKQYDYGARFYDPVIGRWGSVDPLADEFDNVSPYNYALNNPLRYIDPDGMAASDTTTRNGGILQKVWVTVNNFRWPTWTYHIPILGAAAESGNNLADGNYLLSVGNFGTSLAELYTAGLLSEVKIGSITINQTVNAANRITKLSTSKLVVTHSITKSKTAFAKLKADIKLNGIKEPIKFVEHNGKNYVVDGHHRLRAAKELGIQEVPVEKVNLPYAGYKTVDDLIYTQY
ncbi:RHS repeat-associated core domain-containing protein [Parapedobacter sp. DT-150]|uniref:RHS repeat-associated core domain-containing protein n=1 Tax=Parapedobacter sp. DT-150 TaxID=3396162 RepID=UPI003F1BD508